MNEYEVGKTISCSVTFTNASGNLVDPTTVTAYIEQPDGNVDLISSITNSAVGVYSFWYTITIEGEHRYQFTGSTPALSLTVVESDFFTAILYTYTSLDYLIPYLRLHLGDTTPASYKYTRELLRDSLVMSCKALMKRWRNRYIINSANDMSRGATSTFSQTSPPIIEYGDERAFILQSGIIIKSAELSDSAWDIASWKDDEISYSNIAGGKTLGTSLQRDIDELESWFKKRLYGTSKQSITGFRLPPNVREGYI